MIADRAPDRTLAAALVRAQFPEIDSVEVSLLGEGCDSVAFDVNGEWVFRFPKRPDVEAQIAIEAALLRSLADRGSPLPVPAFRFHGRPSGEFPFHFGGYAKLPGLPANRVEWSPEALRRLAPVLGHFLTWLHAFPIDAALALGVPDQRDDDVIAEVRKEALEDFAFLNDVAASAPLVLWRHFLEDELVSARPPAAAFALVHNDLAGEHVLVDAAAPRVTGVIDWSDAAIGDRALDFAGIVHWGGLSFLHDVLAGYGLPVDEHLPRRARFFAVGRGVLDVRFGLERDDRAYVDGGIRAIQKRARVILPSVLSS